MLIDFVVRLFEEFEIKIFFKFYFKFILIILNRINNLVMKIVRVGDIK